MEWDTKIGEHISKFETGNFRAKNKKKMKDKMQSYIIRQ